MMMRRWCGWLLILLLLQALFPGSAAPAPVRPPNILLIVSDDQGWRDLGCFGREEILTPRLDQLAREGVRATSFYVTWPGCTPSRGSILTGRYPQRNGLYDMIRNDLVNYGHRFTETEYAVSPEMTLGLDLREVLIAQPLRQAGYRCGAVGKWDGGRARRFLPLQRGFDFFYGFCNTGIDYYTHERYGIPSMFRGNERTTADRGTYATTLFEREALRFVRENREQPFFLYLAFNAPHGASTFADNPVRPGAGLGVQAPAEWLAKYPQHDPTNGVTRYLAAVTCMDASIGALLDLLRELGLEQNTLVMFFSDNGGSGNGGNAPLRAGKGTLFDGGLRVPFIASWPGQIPANTQTDAFLSTLEVFPTLLAAAGANPPPGLVLDGFNMLPVLQGKAKSSRTEMFWQMREAGAARVGSIKWVDSPKGGGRFDLSADPGEKRDLTASRPTLADQLRARFAAWRREMDAAEPRGPFRNY
jgi:arylsulfatase A-like enzyme